ncbi:MAG TPA: hypothetical protein ENI20_16455 [Bacteroides sp.]|nr:hypothetical protein [Bacteroides sp.]
MNKEKLIALLEKYEQGLCSEEEEDFLINHADFSDESDGAWFNYLKHQERRAPGDLDQRIWDSINSLERGKYRLIKRISLAAASVALLISILFKTIPWQQRAMSYEEKAAVLEEALSMLEEGRQEPERKVIYEDNLIIIYTE